MAGHHGERIAIARARRKPLEAQQSMRLPPAGRSYSTGPLIKQGHHRLLALLGTNLRQQPFLFGGRPASADFALHGQLTQLARFDPTPMAIALQEAPRVVAWVDVADDLSGLEVDDGQWLTRREALVMLAPVLWEIGRTWVPVLRANAEAVRAGAARVSTEVDRLPWVQKPFPHQERSLGVMRETHARLAPATRRACDAVLGESGCAALFEPLPLPAA